MAINNDSASLYDQKIVWLKQNPSACAKPFQSLFLLPGQQGMRAIPCCNWREDELEFGLQYSDLFQGIKQDILENKTNRQCRVCTHSEKHNSVSERMRDTVNTLNENLEFNPHVDYARVTIKFSNFCNLACRMCQPEFSSLLADILQQPADSSFTQDITTDPVIWPVVQQYVIDMLEKHRFVEINLTGGETMVQPGLERLIEWLTSLNQDLSQRVVLSATTNATKINQVFVDSISQFRKVFLNFSIDSVGTNYHYVRWPAQFERVERTMQQAVELKAGNPGTFNFNINLAVSLNNVFYIDDIAKYWYDWGQANQQHPDFSIMYLHHPEHMAVEIIPQQYRSELAKRCEHALIIAQLSNAPEWNAFRTFIAGVYDFCKHNRSDNFQLWNQYLESAADYDNRTDCKMSQHNSRLWELLSDSDQAIYNNA
jgi:hypothetical protein